MLRLWFHGPFSEAGPVLLVALLSLACGSSSADGSGDACSGLAHDPVANGEPEGRAQRLAVDKTDELPELVIGDLPALVQSTTPQELTLRLQANIDHVAVRTYLSDSDGVDIWGCQVLDIYRIGKDAVSWPVGESLTVPLAYGVELPPGVYSQTVQAYSDTVWIDGTGHEGHYEFFEVADGALRPQALSDDSTYQLPQEASLACPAPAPHSDVVSADAAISAVDFDSWGNVPTMQPLRWINQPPVLGLAFSPELEFGARTGDGQRLRVSLGPVPSEPPAALDVSLELDSFCPGAPPGRGYVSLDEPDGSSWSSRGGQIRMQYDGSQMTLTLSDVVLAKQRSSNDEPETTRTVGSGTIRGALIRESSRF